MIKKVLITKAFFLIFLLFFTSCNISQNYKKQIQQYTADINLISGNVTKIPVKVKYLTDSTGQLTCTTLPEQEFQPAKEVFSAGLNSNVIWMDLTFSLPAGNGNEFVVDFGIEPYLAAEMYIERTSGWSFFGRTGRILSRAQMSNPSWRQYVSFTVNDFYYDSYQPQKNLSENKNEYNTDEAQEIIDTDLPVMSTDYYDQKTEFSRERHIRIRMITTNNIPVTVHIIPARVFHYRNTILMIVNFSLMGIATSIILFLLGYMIIFKDKLFLYTTICAFCLLTATISVKGFGPIYLWNGSTYLRSSLSLIYLIANIGLIFLTGAIGSITITTYGKVKLKNLMTTSFFLSILSSILLLVIQDLNAFSFIFFSFFLINAVILLIILIKNLPSPKKGTFVIFLSWIILMILSILRFLFQMLRCVSDARIFWIFSNDFYFFYDVFFLILTLPLILTIASRVQRYIKIFRIRFENALKKLNTAQTEKRLYETLINELSEEHNVTINLLDYSEKENFNDDETITLLKKTAAQTQQLLTIVHLFEKNKTPEPDLIQLVPFFNSCKDMITPYAKNHGNSFSSIASIPDDLVVYINQTVLEFFFTTFIIHILKLTPRNQKIKLYLSVTDNLLTFGLVGATSEFKQPGKNAEDFSKVIDEDNFIFYIAKKACSIYRGNFKIEYDDNFFTCKATFETQQITKLPTKKAALVASLSDEYIQVNSLMLSSQMNVSDNIFSIAGKSPNILLVEFNSDNMESISKILGKYSSVYHAANGLEAWDFLANVSLSSKPNLIICEYNLPQMNGVQLLRKCTQEEAFQNIPFLFILSANEKDKRNDIISRGGADCIMKPFTQEDLFYKVYGLLNVQNMTQRFILSKITNAVQTDSNSDYNLLPAEKSKATSITEEHKKIPAAKRTVALTSTQHTLFEEAKLSAREQQIAILISEGKTDKEIAEELFISPQTVATHNKKVFKKLDVHSRVELMNKIR